MNKRKRVSKEHHGIIITKYLSGQTMTSLSIEFGVSITPIINILKKNNIKIRSPKEQSRKYTVNSYYFLDINTEDKAYFLGLFYADGYVSSLKTKNKTLYSGICLCGEEELELLEKFKKYCEFSGPITKHIKVKERYKQPYRICIIDEIFRETLISKGCVPLKSLVLKFPSFNEIPKHLFHHFLRGFWDGDGSISFYQKSGELGISAITSVDFAKSFTEFAKNNLDIKFSISSKNNSMVVSLNGKKDVLRFLLYLYKDASIFLQRKKSKLDEFINFYKENLNNFDFFKSKRSKTIKYIEALLDINIISTFNTKLTQSQRDMVLNCYKNNISIYEIARRVGINTGVVTRYLKFMGFDTLRERLLKYKNNLTNPNPIL